MVRPCSPCKGYAEHRFSPVHISISSSGQRQTRLQQLGPLTEQIFSTTILQSSHGLGPGWRFLTELGAGSISRFEMGEVRHSEQLLHLSFSLHIFNLQSRGHFCYCVSSNAPESVRSVDAYLIITGEVEDGRAGIANRVDLCRSLLSATREAHRS